MALGSIKLSDGPRTGGVSTGSKKIPDIQISVPSLASKGDFPVLPSLRSVLKSFAKGDLSIVVTIEKGVNSPTTYDIHKLQSLEWETAPTGEFSRHLIVSSDAGIEKIDLGEQTTQLTFKFLEPKPAYKSSESRLLQERFVKPPTIPATTFYFQPANPSEEFLIGMNNRLIKRGFIKDEVEIYCGNDPVPRYQGLLRDKDPLQYRRDEVSIVEVFDRNNNPTVISSNEDAWIRVVKKGTIPQLNAGQTVTLQVSSAKDFVDKLNDLLKRLPYDCTLKIEGLKDLKGIDLPNLTRDVITAVQGLNLPQQIWILNAHPFRIEPEFGREYQCVVGN